MFEVLGTEGLLARDQLSRGIDLSPNIPEQHTTDSSLLLVIDDSFTMGLFPIREGSQPGIELTNRFVAEFEKIGIEKRQVLILFVASSHVASRQPPHRVGVIFVFDAHSAIERG